MKGRPLGVIFQSRVVAVLSVFVLLAIRFAFGADMSGNVATYRNDAAHKTDGERCLKILSNTGIDPKIVDGFFAIVTVPPADTDRAQKLIGHAIEQDGLHVRLLHAPPDPERSYESIGFYRDEDRKDGERAMSVLYEHGISAGGAGIAGMSTLCAQPERAAEGRRILSQLIRAENLKVVVDPADHHIESPGALYFLRHITIPADQAPEGRATTRLIIVKNIEVYPLTFTAEKVWSGEMPTGAVTTAWSPDARFLIFAGAPAGESTRMFYVDLATAHPQTAELDLRTIAAASHGSEVKETGKQNAQEPAFSANLKEIAWANEHVAHFQLTQGTGDQQKLEVVKLDLKSSPPALTVD